MTLYGETLVDLLTRSMFEDRKFISWEDLSEVRDDNDGEYSTHRYFFHPEEKQALIEVEISGYPGGFAVEVNIRFAIGDNARRNMPATGYLHALEKRSGVEGEGLVTGRFFSELLTPPFSGKKYYHIGQVPEWAVVDDLCRLIDHTLTSLCE